MFVCGFSLCLQSMSRKWAQEGLHSKGPGEAGPGEQGRVLGGTPWAHCPLPWCRVGQGEGQWFDGNGIPGHGYK